ncbi:hypothetical protein [Haliea salexigens]|uniref:hypothetical protein n=1 Tax=Haliea salexigens TaxID=287487 RepID=UPI0004822350|nr:hypothetical protein [Haliea salexigens]
MIGEVLLRVIFSKTILALLVVVIAGCNQKFEDISSSPEFRSMIGTKYVVKKALLIHGVTPDIGQEHVQYFAITRTPGMGGPEVLSSEPLVVGSVVLVTKVERCSNCLFGSPIHIVVELIAGTLSPQVPVRIYQLRSIKENGDVFLTSEYFERI